MTHFRYIPSILSLFCLFGILDLTMAQIVKIEPAFFSIDNSITVTYDASQGNKGLENVDQVFMHTGLITKSGGPGNWQNVQGEWGTDDAKVKMTNIGGNLHQLTMLPRSFYNLSQSEQGVEQLAFVFRNVDGSKEGKTASGGDIFITLPETGNYNALLQSPTEQHIVLKEGASILVEIVASASSDISIYDNDKLIHEEIGTEVSFDYAPTIVGDHIIKYEARADGELIQGSFSLVYNPTLRQIDPPIPLKLGLNRTSSNEAYISLYAPDKEFVHLLTNINDYQVTESFAMNRTMDGSRWWIQLENLDPNVDYNYQFLVDGNLKVADPLSELILDPIHDPALSNYTELPTYPSGLTDGHVTSFRSVEENFNWTDQNFIPVKEEDLVIYEILMRDFLASHNYEDLADTLTYLKKLGINAIELMPIQEFEANESWGYNPSYHMALDKYYGSPLQLKALVEQAHELGIAVILDVVFNHAFGQSPLAQLYWDSANNRPSSVSPYFNQEARHPFNVGFDFNHESPATKEYVKRVMSHWVEEYHIDGFRFDLSKGFTQRQSNNNVEMSAYDGSRVTILADYAQHLWTIDPDLFVILEHFSDDLEELELSAYGMMLWSNGNSNFNEATMGYHDNNKSDLSILSYQDKGWVDPFLIGYMESHDEERLMYKNLQFGNSSATYSVQDPSTALERNELAAVFFFSIPGPKMIWQFGELGYDYSINQCVDGSVGDCRLDIKPIRWDYLEDPQRRSLSDIYKSMIELKLENDLFKTRNYSLSVGGAVKAIQLKSDTANAIVIGNFNVTDISTTINFQKNGSWYDYFTGEEIEVEGNFHQFDLAAGEYRLYFDSQDHVTTATKDLADIGIDLNVYPNPSEDYIYLKTNSEEPVTANLEIIDSNGKVMSTKRDYRINQGSQTEMIDVHGLRSGAYFIHLQSKEGRSVLPFAVIR